MPRIYCNLRAMNSGQDYNPSCVCATQQSRSDLPFLQAMDLNSRAQVRLYFLLVAGTTL